MRLRAVVAVTANHLASSVAAATLTDFTFSASSTVKVLGV
jgi:hypothetical protein